MLYHPSKVTENINRELAKYMYIEPDINQYAYTGNKGTGKKLKSQS